MIEKDEDGYLIASVTELKGCHTQALSLEELQERIEEVIELCLETQNRWAKRIFMYRRCLPLGIQVYLPADSLVLYI